MELLPNLEIYNSSFTSKYGEWALGFCGGLYDTENPRLETITSLDLSDRCIRKLSHKVADILYLIEKLVFFYL